MDMNQESLKLHYEMQGKIEVISRRKIETREDLSLLYTPGVAEPCRQIAEDYNKSFHLTRRSNLVAVITDGTAVLGLGDIGPAAGGAAVIDTGRSDYPNQINNVLVFPGMFKGALSVRAREITESMKRQAAYAIAGMIPEKDLRADYIIPSPLDRKVAEVVAEAVAETAVKEGNARI